MTNNLNTIPLDAIDVNALIRDRVSLDPEALDELQGSIFKHGLRMPIEVYETEPAEGRAAFGLISGFRRVEVFKRLRAATGLAEYAAIPAFVRDPQSIPAAMVAMVEENEVRAEVSPYERGRIAMLARDSGFFGTIEEAVDVLYAAASPQKRSRLRSLARLAEEVDGFLAAPERLSQAQALRLSNACRAGFGEVIRTALVEASMTEPEGQWQLLQPILAEAEETAKTEAGPSRPGRPRRVLKPQHGLTVRRELARDGWVLRFTGREATGELIELVMDEIERWLKRD